MKIESGRSIGAAPNGRKAESAGGPAFAPAMDGPAKTTAAAAVSAAHPLDAILALQAEGFQTERRARQVRRGQAALDALSELEGALLSGLPPADLRARLENLRRGGERTEEDGLDDVMREIDTRLAVELAKLEMAGALA